MAETSFDLVLCYANLPDATGTETLSELLRGDPSQTILTLTGIEDEAFGLACIDAGAEAFVTKDKLDAATLRRTIAHAYQRSHERRRELSRALDEARRANDLKTKFLAKVSHELRAPLTSMIGYLDLIRDEPIPKSTVEMVDISREAAQILLATANDLLDLSQAESQTLKLVPKATDYETSSLVSSHSLPRRREKMD